MLIVVTGGSGSGKSLWAEQIARELVPDSKIYLATMIAYDEESKKRVEKHRIQRAGKGFRTVEKPTHIEELEIDGEPCILLECMSNLVANEMYDDAGVKENVASHIMEGIAYLRERTDHLIVVTNEVFSGIEEYEETKRYLEVLGAVNRELASQADVFVESVYGILVVHKGEEEWRIDGKSGKSA